MLCFLAQQNIWDFSTQKPLSVEAILTALCISAGLSLLLSWHFVRFGSTFSNRTKFSRVLLPITLTTTLIIAVVKANLALSLGLVGALSIVRFRTPVKEPEELSYLFLAISIGLGIGADQWLVTSCAILCILFLLGLRSIFKKESKFPNLYLNLEFPDQLEKEGLLKTVMDSLSAIVTHIDLRRFDVQENKVQATFYLDCKDSDKLIEVQDELQKKFPGLAMTFIEQSGVTGG